MGERVTASSEGLNSWVMWSVPRVGDCMRGTSRHCCFEGAYWDASAVGAWVQSV